MEFKIMKVTKTSKEVSPDVFVTRFKYELIGMTDEESKMTITTCENDFKIYDYLEIDVVKNEDKK